MVIGKILNNDLVQSVSTQSMLWGLVSTTPKPNLCSISVSILGKPPWIFFFFVQLVVAAILNMLAPKRSAVEDVFQ